MRDLQDRIDAIPGRLSGVCDRIFRACERSGRDADDVTVVGVTKTFPVALVEAAIAAGIADIGENRVQEGLEKVEAVGRHAAVWHLVGHLQTNKAKHAVSAFDLFHGLDSVRLADEVQKRAENADMTMAVLVQVNTSGEESKYGVPPDGLRPLLEHTAGLDRLQVEGLMTIAPFDQREEVVRPAFVGLRRLFEDVPGWGLPRVEMRHLSMGMSNDFEWAVEEGATIVRLGSVLFGPRG
jgi:pyridoxal phosphate enzyme (YggS family)